MMKQLIILFLCLCVSLFATAQTSDRWQQRAEYKMDIDFDVKKHQFTGKQSIKYYNNSNDALNRVFYHLYFNAFQPGSMMDVRSRTIKDADRRVGGRIAKLQPNEIGYHKIKSLTQNGKPVKYEVVGTILEVELNEKITPNSTATFDMEFESQVPLQIRRSGRMSKEGIDYSMTQWFPKMCEYDYQGWHANPYVGREFHGVWGDFDVTINIDKNYILGGSGVLVNADEIGYGYSDKVDEPTTKGEKAAWHFVAEKVHDFAWAADPDYTHTKVKTPDGFDLHFLYQKNEKTEDVWAKLPETMVTSYEYIKSHYGEYPYPQYTFIQGGDGGMEYPMITLITGHRSFGSLVGVSVHEWMHTWYQMLMATNESLYAWMDEGFTSYGSAEVMNYLVEKGKLNGEATDNPHKRSVAGYARFSQSGAEEPLSTHADHFMTNQAYGVGSYVKGAVFLRQLHYIVGEKAFDKAMLDYYDKWKFRHPNPNDFIRVVEKAADMELDWFKEYFVNTTHTADYAVKTVEKEGRKTIKIKLEKIGVMPMPLDVVVTDKKGNKTTYNIPLRIMRGEKKNDIGGKYEVKEDWPWTHPDYELVVDGKLKNIVKVEIDPSERLADVNRDNNNWEKVD